MKVSIYSLWNENKLPENVKEYLIEESIWCDDVGCVLIVEDKGEIILCETDRMEPEDATFGRDLSWIPEALEKAYELGKEEGWKCCEYVQSLIPLQDYSDLS